MYELKQVSEKCCHINCPAKIGVYVPDQDNVYLVDSGNDKDAGRKVRQILDKNGWRLPCAFWLMQMYQKISGDLCNIIGIRYTA